MTLSASSGGAAAAAAAAAVANAIKAFGAIISVEPKEFATILNKSEKPLVVVARGGWMNRQYRYLTSYKGLFFYTKTKESLIMPHSVEIINCKKIMIPGS